MYENIFTIPFKGLQPQYKMEYTKNTVIELRKIAKQSGLVRGDREPVHLEGRKTAGGHRRCAVNDGRNGFTCWKADPLNVGSGSGAETTPTRLESRHWVDCVEKVAIAAGVKS